MILNSNSWTMLRLFRRRHKISLITSVIIVLLLVFVLINSFALSNAIDTTSSTIYDPDQISGKFTDVLSNLRILGASQKKKTVPFAKTDAASQSEFNNMITTTSNKILNHMDDATKIRLIHESHKKFDPSGNLLRTGYAFYDSIFKVLLNGKPKARELNRYPSDKRIYHARYDSKVKDDLVFDEEYLSSFLQLNDDQLKSMTESHKYVVNNLPEKAPEGFYSGDGIVYVGGGKFNWLTLLSIKSIRAIGSELPIEVLIPNLDEYEPDLCARVFPALNARCIFLPFVSKEEGKESFASKFKFEGYQYKALAVLVLSFENVLLLDSDNTPVHPPDHLFQREPFKSNGLIVWPDFWKRATSPNYYKIANTEISTNKLLPKYNEILGTYHPAIGNSKNLDTNKTPLHDRKGAIPDPTSESGQLMISKKTHTKALLLALYYNLYGPKHYYPLFSQGSDGEGDKETFLAATVALGKPFYQVSKFLNAFGYFDNNNDFQGTGMGQYDPVEDYAANVQRKIIENKSSEEQEVLISKDPILKDGPRILFVHANFPKLNPWELKTSGKIFNSEGQRIRLYGTGMKKRTGYDFETVQWSNMKFLLCELNIQVNLYKNVDRGELCTELNEHLDFLKSTIASLE